ncbi:MAG TPA: TIGR01212 family radical SAM protein [Spirochaetota bacterium]|nr:TIGR01212 family radical SAM protein [Spirochaetota bacterium]
MHQKTNRFKAGGWHGKPYNFFGDHLLTRFGTRVLKLPLDARLGCPNRDGTLDDSGCIFCSDDGSASPAVRGAIDIREQMETAAANFKRADERTRFIAYFQAFTNTYAPVDRLKALYDTAVSGRDIVGLMVGTRPDCLGDDVIGLIDSYARDDFELWVEIGMQSMHDRSLAFLNRHHSHKDTRDAVLRASGRNIDLCLHVILGIPGKSWEDMMATAVEVSSLPVRGVKLHHLHVIEGTPLESIYRAGGVRPLEFGEYVSTVCDFIERLRPDIMIHRLLGDREETSLVAPRWGLHKGTVLKAIENEFAKRGSFQGLLYEARKY